MTAIAGTVVYNTVVTVTAASSGDATTIAGLFNGVLIAAVSATTTATAAHNSTTATVSWPQTAVRAGNSTVLDVISNMIAADTSLTSPISITVATVAELTS